ncbi:unnamed protein product [Cochlearia groenlandica]
MTEMPSHMIKNPKNSYYHSSSLLSMLLSIFTYVLIFYVFEVSPSSIFKDTKILFFISNTLILIIAADYKNQSHDFHGEYTEAVATIKSPTTCSYDSPIFKNREDQEIKKPNEEESTTKEIVSVSPPEKIVRVVSEEMRGDLVAIKKQKHVIDRNRVSEETCDARNHANPKSYLRTKSDKPRRMRLNEDTKANIKRKSYRRSESDRSKWMVVHEKWENVEDESEEFSKLSNEELNKRVEDFIQKFNREMRLQSSQVSSKF